MALQDAPRDINSTRSTGEWMPHWGWLLVLGLAALLLSGCAEQKAIKTVQNAHPPNLNLFGALMGIGANPTWKEQLEAGVRFQGDSVDRYRWEASRMLPGLRDGEWYVSFIDTSDTGHFFVANIRTSQVVHLNTDLIAAERIGFLKADTNPRIEIEVDAQGWERCSDWSDRGWCWAIKGVATNMSEPVVSVDAGVRLALQIGDKTIEGSRRSGSAPDKFRYTSESRPWPVGQGRTFKYRSEVVPDVYASPGTTGSGVAVFEITSETATRGKLAEQLIVDRFAWPGVLAVQ